MTVEIARWGSSQIITRPHHHGAVGRYRFAAVEAATGSHEVDCN